jgi:protein-disulfide isomerase
MSTAGGDEQDLTRKQRREQARTQRKELEEAQAASALRRTRLIQLGVLGAIVVAIVVGIIVATSGGGKSKGIATTPTPGGPPPAVVTEVSALLNGIPQSGNTLGSPTAPVTLQYYADLECPVCRTFTEGALKPLIEADVRTGKLKIEYRSLQTATKEAETFKSQQVAALAAGKQQKAWYYVELFYHQQGEENTGYVTESYLQGIAKQIPGLELSKWSNDRSSPELASSLRSDTQDASTFGFTGTPSFALGKTGGTAKKFEAASLTDPSSFEAQVQALLKK